MPANRGADQIRHVLNHAFRLFLCLILQDGTIDPDEWEDSQAGVSTGTSCYGSFAVFA